MARGDLIEVKPLGSANYTALPTPTTYKMTSTTLVDSGRNSNGIIISHTVREGIRKIEITWNFLSQANFSLVAKLFESSVVGGVGGFICYLKYYDTIRGEMVTSENEHINNDNSLPLRSFYVGDRVSDSAKLTLNSDGSIKGYANVKLSLIEC